MNTVKVGVVVFVLKDQKLLLGKRKNIVGDGAWGLPGGKLEFGERVTDAARRELEEETGLVAKELDFLELVNDPREDTHYIHVGFLARSISGEPVNKEPEKCSELDWFDLEDLPGPIFYGHEKLIRGFKQKKNFID